MNAPTHEQPPVIPLNRFFWWAVFLLDTVALSWFLHWFKAFTLAPNWEHGGMLLAVTLLLVGSFMILLYDGYAKEKSRGTLGRRFSPFERVYAWQLARLEKMEQSEGDSDPCKRR
jgi:hypothetical protein